MPNIGENGTISFQRILILLGMTDNKDIANEFFKSSSSVYFNSYSNTKETFNCMELADRTQLTECSIITVGDNNMFHIEDIENTIKPLSQVVKLVRQHGVLGGIGCAYWQFD